MYGGFRKGIVITLLLIAATMGVAEVADAKSKSKSKGAARDVIVGVVASAIYDGGKALGKAVVNGGKAVVKVATSPPKCKGSGSSGTANSTSPTC